MSERINEKKDEELILLSKKGDKIAEEELLRRHAGLVRSCARRYFLVDGETEDLLQEGMIGLYRAIGGYDSEKANGQSFKNFAYLCIMRSVLDAVKGVYRKKNGNLYSIQPLDSMMVERGMGPEELLILSDEQREFKEKMTRALSDFEFKVTTLYMDGLTCAEICERTGKPAKSVDNAIQRSKRKLMEIFKK